MATTPEATDPLPTAPAVSAESDAEDVYAVAREPHPHAKHGKRLSLLQRASIIDAKRRNPSLSLAQLATLIGCSRQTIAYTLSAQQAHAADLMRGATLDMLTVWEEAAQKAAEKGYHQPAKDYLLHAGVIDPVDTGAGTRVNVGVQLVVPGLPGAGSPLATFAPCAPFALTGEGGESETTVIVEGNRGESDKAHYVNSEVQAHTGVPGEERKGGEGERG